MGYLECQAPCDPPCPPLRWGKGNTLRARRGAVMSIYGNLTTFLPGATARAPHYRGGLQSTAVAHRRVLLDLTPCLWRAGWKPAPHHNEHLWGVPGR